MPFFAFEGLSCSGKTTLISKLVKVLENKDVCVTSEPYDDKYASGENIRRVLNAGELSINSPVLTDMILTNKALHFEEVIAPALKANKIVLCDRWIASTFVYQHPEEKSYIFEEKIRSFVRNLKLKFKVNPTPDVTFFLDITKSAMEERLTKRSLFYSSKDWVNWNNFDDLRKRYLHFGMFNTSFKSLSSDLPLGDLVSKTLEEINTTLASSLALGRHM